MERLVFILTFKPRTIGSIGSVPSTIVFEMNAMFCFKCENHRMVTMSLYTTVTIHNIPYILLYPHLHFGPFSLSASFLLSKVICKNERNEGKNEDKHFVVPFYFADVRFQWRVFVLSVYHNT